MKLFTVVPQQTKCIVERLGKYHKTLEPGFHFLIPFVDNVQYSINFKEQAIHVKDQRAITRDNVALTLDGVVFFRIEDEQKASYSIGNYSEALKLLAMTSMRSELGKIELNNVFSSRKELNQKILHSLAETTHTWGISCDRYEILKIEPPREVRQSMQLQAEAERIRRKDIILSEAQKISDINLAEGRKQSDILNAEARAESIEIKARKEKEGLQLIAKNIMAGQSKGMRALDYILKRKYFEEYAKILREGNITVLPESSGNGGSSDTLAAVAMMLNSEGRQKAPRRLTKEESQPAALADSTQSAGTSSRKIKSGTLTGDQTLANKVDFSKLQFFNDPLLDKSSR